MKAAIGVFAVRGFEAGSLRRIAELAQVDPALIIHTFGSKTGLWEACICAVSEDLVAALAHGSAESSNSLPDAADCLIDALLEEPVSAQFILSEIVRQDERFEYVFEHLVQPIQHLLRGKTGKAETDSRDEIGLLAISGAISIAIVARGFMVKRGLMDYDQANFRLELRQVIEPMIAREFMRRSN